MNENQEAEISEATYPHVHVIDGKETTPARTLTTGLHYHKWGDGRSPGWFLMDADAEDYHHEHSRVRTNDPQTDSFTIEASR